MKGKKIAAIFITIITALALSACSSSDNSSSKKETGEQQKKDGDQMNMDHSKMDMSGSDGVPKGLKDDQDPTYKVGSKAIVTADHMKGMKGAEAKIVGAYDTTAYAISYNPTNGGKRVTNHKWVIQEEIQGAGDEELKKGTEVTVNADHMEGMNGAKATIDSAEKTTVYMIDYKPTNGGKTVKNHKWVTESELKQAK
ncbi:YdhK family protein [Falsibacillus pallidus]|uniref:YdhK family protein n=1 Tax=Falsibacillus pallidus TaxID=493781 RepID=UPI003D989A3B